MNVIYKINLLVECISILYEGTIYWNDQFEITHCCLSQRLAAITSNKLSEILIGHCIEK